MKKIMFVVMCIFIGGNVFAASPRFRCNGKKDANGNFGIVSGDVVSDFYLDNVTFRLNGQAAYTKQLDSHADKTSGRNNWRRFRFDAEPSSGAPKATKYHVVLPVGFSKRGKGFPSVFRVFNKDGSQFEIKMGCQFL